MTQVLHSSHTEKLGVAEVQRVAALARTIFRPIGLDDVGIDGWFELVEGGAATGIIAGVQIKSGDAFVDENGTSFTFRSDQDHFGYWARCSFPVIGVVFSPDHQKSVWFDLTSLSTDDRIANGPYSITLGYSESTAFTPTNLSSQVEPIIRGYAHQRRTLWQIRELLRPRREKADLEVPSLEVNSEKEEAWHALTETFLGLSSTDEEVADAGYRLSWYFPSVPEHLQQALKDRLVKIDDFSLVRALRIVDRFIVDNAEPAAELVVDLLQYVPKITTRIEKLLNQRMIPSADAEGAIQTVEVLEQENRNDLRSLFDA